MHLFASLKGLDRLVGVGAMVVGVDLIGMDTPEGVACLDGFVDEEVVLGGHVAAASKTRAATTVAAKTHQLVGESARVTPMTM